ncbi:MAG: cation:proton antiporter [Candidatus Pacebacteria bacterium]|nr:cation:proton antiporter [Candidatus Paceibacterota bacterium]
MNIFVELSILLLVTTVITLVVKLLKQPLVVGYILAGIVTGPYFLNVLHSTHELELFSKVGIVFLLFIVGLHLNPKVIKEVGSISLVTGIGQVVFTSLIGFFLAILLGIDRLAALYVAIALTFSSTIIILKLLADKKDLQKLYAKIAIGFLLVQDVIATFVLIGVTVFTNGGEAGLLYTLGLTFIKGFGLLVGLYLFTSLVLQKLTSYIARSQELLFLFSLAWGTGLASLFLLLGFSIEIGALVAGVTMSLTPYADEMSSRLKPLRDFFIIIFFILLGSQMVLANLSTIILPALFLSLFVLIGNPIIVILLMNLAGYSRRTGFLAGLTVAQISEFSLILASLGMRVGHLSQEVLSLVTLVGLITIAGSTYLILYADNIYPKIANILKTLELLKRRKTEKGAIGEDYSSVIFGFDRVGDIFADALTKAEQSFLVVDYNPASIQRVEKLQLPFRYGDASDVEFLEELPLTKPLLVVSTIPDFTTSKLIIRMMLEKNPRCLIVPIAHTTVEAKELYDLGAAFVVIPHLLGAEYAARMIKRLGVDKNAYLEEKQKHLEKLVI